MDKNFKWHYLPELPEVNKEVLIAIKYDNIPIQGYWNGTFWKGSFVVRDNMAGDMFLPDDRIVTAEWIYAWSELPECPPVPDPF